MRATIKALTLAGIAIATSAGAARPTDAERMAKELSGYTAGKEMNCINQFPSLSSSTYRDAIVYRDGRRRYVNRFDGSCQINVGDILVTRTPTNLLCRGDIAQVIDSTTQVFHGSCVFGNFQTYTRAK